MTETVLDVLKFDAEIAKRAQWEGFEFRILGEQEIEVVNASHEDPEAHTHTVHVEGDLPSDCTCKAWEYREGACKHVVAVAIREPILAALSDEQSVDATERPEECECTELCKLPCWYCYAEGFEEPNVNKKE